MEYYLEAIPNQTDRRAIMLDPGIFILDKKLFTLHDNICITSTRAIAQLVEHLVYTCANVFQSSPSCNQKN